MFFWNLKKKHKIRILEHWSTPAYNPSGYTQDHAAYNISLSKYFPTTTRTPIFYLPPSPKPVFACPAFHA